MDIFGWLNDAQPPKLRYGLDLDCLSPVLCESRMNNQGDEQPSGPGLVAESRAIQCEFKAEQEMGSESWGYPHSNNRDDNGSILTVNNWWFNIKYRVIINMDLPWISVHEITVLNRETVGKQSGNSRETVKFGVRHVVGQRLLGFGYPDPTSSSNHHEHTVYNC